MLTLSSPDLPATATVNPSAGAAIAHIADDSEATGLLASITFSSGLEIETTEVVTLPAASNGEMAIAIPSTTKNVASIVIDGTTYKPTADEDGTPAAGEFYFDPDTNTATVNLGDATPTTGTSAQLQSLGTEYTGETDRWTGNIPSFLREWNISGDISLSRTFEGSPSGSLEFTTASSNARSVRTTLRNGTKVVLFGRGYAVSDIQLSDQGQGFIDVSVGLQGAHDIGLDTNVLLRTDTSTATVSLSTLAERAGLDYRGPDIQVPIDREASLKATTTLGQELARARASRGFPFFSNPNSVRIKRWGQTKLHVISDADVMSGAESPLQTAYGGQGNVWKSFQLSDEYLNRELLLDVVDTVDDAEGNGRKNTVRTVVSGENLITSASLQLDLREPTGSFDLGGPTIKRTVTQYRNELETWVEEDEFGYAYACSQVYLISTVVDTTSSFTTAFTTTPTYSDSLADGRFMRVRTRLTRTFFDADNYLIRRTTRIRELKRYKQETNVKEAIALAAAVSQGIASFANQQLLNLYEDFFWTERVDTEEWTLENFASRYPDVDLSQFDYSPKFATHKIRRDLILESTPNPEVYYFTNDVRQPSDNVIFLDLPPLVTGSDFRDTEQLSVVYPESGISKSRYRPEKDAFKTTRTTESKQGAELQQGLAIATVDERLGRPSEHTRLPEYDEDGNVSGNGPDESNVTLLLRTPNTGLTDDDPIEGSISFPGADTREKAIAAAETEISILNTLGVEIINLLLIATRRYDEGDLVNWRGNTYVVLAIQEQFRVESVGAISVQPWNVTLGKLMQPTVTVSEVDNGQ